MRILFISTGLALGGAEVMLVNLATALVSYGHIVHVVGLRGPGGVTARLRAIGVTVDECEVNSVFSSLRMVSRLRGIVLKFSPDIIQGWMYQGCLAASFSGALTGVPVTWSLHHSNFEPSYNGRGTLASIRMAAWVSRLMTPAGIAYCGPNSRDAHHRHGFVRAPASVLPNGVDFEKFRPDDEVRTLARREIGMGDAQVLIGIFANRVPIKDHSTFFKAAAKLATTQPEVRFVCCGGGMSADAPDLVAELESVSLTERVLLLGRRHDVAAVMNACDIIVLTSRGESFPMALTEAAACGIPVVATDVGDCAWVVGSSERLFSPGDVSRLISILTDLVSMQSEQRKLLGDVNRSRILPLFSLTAVVDSYLAFAKKSAAVRTIKVLK